jgi:hypothetical protein
MELSEIDYSCPLKNAKQHFVSTFQLKLPIPLHQQLNLIKYTARELVLPDFNFCDENKGYNELCFFVQLCFLNSSIENLDRVGLCMKKKISLIDLLVELSKVLIFI